MCSSLSRYYFPYCYFPRNSWILFRLAPNLLYFESSFVRHLLLRGCCEFGFDSTRNNPVWFASNKVASGGFVSVGKVETMPYFDLWHGLHNRRLFLTDSFPLRILRPNSNHWLISQSVYNWFFSTRDRRVCGYNLFILCFVCLLDIFNLFIRRSPPL